MSKRVIYIIVCSFSITAVFAIGYRQAITDRLHAWQVLPTPENVTQLYFTRHNELPKADKVGSTTAVPFTIRNDEDRTISYRYTVLIQAAGKRYPQQDKTVQVPARQTANITERVSYPALAGRTAVVVNIQYPKTGQTANIDNSQSQTIHFWVTLIDPQETDGA